MKDKKAIALFSGGLDSIVSVAFMQDLGYHVYPVFFRTPYLPSEKAMTSAKDNGFELIVRDISAEHLEMLKNPRYGFGKNLNPCVDCHALMFRMAGEMLPELGADFLISGEVLGQRPMSQRRDAINAVGKICGFKDLLIRPLSQKLLNDTLPIREGWVDKDSLLGISGRSRTVQKDLAKQLNIQYYPQPGGGCLLTEKVFSTRMRDLLDHNQAIDDNICLLTKGRHYRLSDKVKLIIGRDETDNNDLEALAGSSILLQTKSYPGPLGLLTGGGSDLDTIRKAASILLYYNKKAPQKWTVFYGQKYPLDLWVEIEKADLEFISSYHIGAALL